MKFSRIVIASVQTTMHNVFYCETHHPKLSAMRLRLCIKRTNSRRCTQGSYFLPLP